MPTTVLFINHIKVLQIVYSYTPIRANSVLLYYTLSTVQIAILKKKKKNLDVQPSLQYTWAKFGSICWL